MISQSTSTKKEFLIKHLIGLVALLLVFINIDSAHARGSISIEAVVSPQLKSNNITKIAVESFVINGTNNKNSSLADIVNTRLFSTGKYRHANRTQGDEIGKLMAEELKYADNAVEIFGIDALVRGTVTSYEMMTIKGEQVPSIGFTIKLVSLRNLEELWTLSSSGVGQPGQNVGIFAAKLVGDSMNKLIKEWINVGDTQTVNLPQGQILRITPAKKRATIEFALRDATRFASFSVFRSDQRNGEYQFVKTIKNRKTTRPLKHVDRNLAPGTSYYYKVIAVASSGLSAPASDVVSVRIP